MLRSDQRVGVGSRKAGPSSSSLKDKMAAFQAAAESTPVHKPLKKAETTPGKLKSTYKEKGDSQSSPAVVKAVKKKKVVQKKPFLGDADAYDADAEVAGNGETPIKNKSVKKTKEPRSSSKKKTCVVEKNALKDDVGSPSSETNTPVQKKVVKKKKELSTTPSSSTQKSNVQKIPKHAVGDPPFTPTRSPRAKITKLDLKGFTPTRSPRAKITQLDLKGFQHYQSSPKSPRYRRSPKSKNVGVVKEDKESLSSPPLYEEANGDVVVQKEHGKSATPSTPKSPKKKGRVAKVSPSPTRPQSPSKKQRSSTKAATVVSLKDKTKAFQAASKPSTSVTKLTKGTALKVASLRDKTNAFQAASAPSQTPAKVTPPKSKVGASNLKNKANAFRSMSKQAPPPRKNIRSILDKKGVKTDGPSPATGVVAKLKNKSLESQVVEYMNRIEAAGGFPQARRLSIRDNDIVSNFGKAIANDPTISEISIVGDPRFAHTNQSLVTGFAEAIRSNLYVKKVTITGVELGNDFLSALATSLETNFTLESINLSNNSFTNEGMMEFCDALGKNGNRTVTSVDMSKQNSPIFENSEDQVIEELEENKTLQKFKIDFKSKTGVKRIKAILERNKANPPEPIDQDERLLAFLSSEADRAEEICGQRKAEEEILQVKEDDWDYLFKLSQLFEKFRLDDEHVDEDADAKNAPGRNKSFGSKAPSKSGSLESMIGAYSADGSFLTEDFIDKYLVDYEDPKALCFDFCGQFKLFKRFPASDPARPTIVSKFADAILTHPRMKEITGINMANSCCGNDFVQALAERCLADESLLPNLNTLNVETNFIGEPGIAALSKCIANPNVFKYLQVLKLENQRKMLSSKGEYFLAKAMCVNKGIVRFSLRVRNLLERQQINKYIVRNIDFLRQARRHHAIATGTLEERKRNVMEQLFDKIATNDPSVTEVNIVGDLKFLSLNAEEKIKAGAAFANNTHVKKVQMNQLKLDGHFAKSLGEALATCQIEKLHLDSNAIAGDGIKALFEGLANNSSIVEMQVRHQSKPTGSADEDILPDLLEPNETITKLGIDLRGQLAKIKIDRKMTQNREVQRKKRLAAKKS